MKITRAVVPSLFTVLNIFCGFSAVVHTAQSAFHQAAWFIILAAVFDTLDGVMARITRSSSSFGVEFDSLSDVVSFGVAPSFLVYQAKLVGDGGIGLLISSMPLILGALRLARFNSQLVGFTKEYFRGLPIPAAALTLSAYVLAFYVDGSGFSPLWGSALAPSVAVVSLLMVSTIRYDTIPQVSRRGIRQHPVRFTVLVAAVTAIVITRGAAMLPVLGLYLVSGPLRYAVRFIHHALHPVTPELKEDEPGMTSVDV
ncbi:MAG TPA: CDP-diacylglycerol--serine O-phosphatidyltransferase [Bacteroidota bacterium]|nr:CDP-diacylglycerol--serine O-phosphatidyltransferase [Bacteroidota bacterium]